MLAKLQSAIALFTSSCLVCVAASPSNVGFVVTNGEAQVDGSAVHGNSTLFPGSLVQAGSATSDLMFPGGSSLLLQPDSAVKVYREYAVLQKGEAIQRGSHGLVADGLRISSLSAESSIVVGMKDAAHLEVMARGGAAEVRNTTGVLVARLEPGKAFTFSIQSENQGAQQAPSAPAQPQTPSTPIFGIGSEATQITIRGVLRKDHAGRYGHYLLTDEFTKTTYELQGAGLDDLVGASVEAVGSLYDTKPAEGASKVLSLSDIHQMPGSAVPEAAPSTEAAAPPTPAFDAAPASSAGAEVPGAPDATAASGPATAPEATTPAPPPLVVHSDTAKILVIVAIAAGGAVGVALGLAGGKSSTVSPE